MLSKSHQLSSRHTSIPSTPSRRFTLGLPAALLTASGLALFAAGCGGGYVAVVGPPYGCVNCGYGYGGYGGYGYGYGAITTSPVTGKSTPGTSTAGSAAPASTTSQPTALAVDASGNLYIADRATNSVREATATSGSFSRAVSVGPTFQQPASIAIDPSGDLYVLDQTSGIVRRISKSSGAVALVAGSHPGFAGDKSLATSAQLNQPSSIAFDPSGNLFIADTGNNRVREIAAATGIITTIAGNGTAGFSGDGGAASSARLNQPSGIATDTNGNVYIADTANSVIRKIDVATGTITTVAGNGTAGFSGDNAAAVSAQLDQPRGITVSPNGNLFIADTGNQTIREVPASSGTIFTIAGNHSQGYSGDGGASYKAELNTPYATAFDPTTGNMYVADYGNGVVRAVAPSPAPSN